MILMNVLGVSSRTSSVTFLCLVLIPTAAEHLKQKGKQLAVFQVLNHSRDGLLARSSNSTLERGGGGRGAGGGGWVGWRWEWRGGSHS